MFKRFLCAASILCSGAAQAGVTLDIDTEQDLYRVEVRETFQTSNEQLWSVITDVNNYAKMNNSIQYVLALPPEKPESYIRVQSAVKACVWFYCHSTTQLQDFYDISENQAQKLTAIAVPEEGVYKQLDAKWQILEENNGDSILVFNLDIKPDFWVPPVIGPWLIENKIVEEAQESITAIKQILAAK